MVNSNDFKTTHRYLDNDPLFDFESFGWKQLRYRAISFLQVALDDRI